MSGEKLTAQEKRTEYGRLTAKLADAQRKLYEAETWLRKVEGEQGRFVEDLILEVPHD